MILEILKCLAHEMNSQPGFDTKAVVAPIHQHLPAHENQVILSLINIEEDIALRNFPQANALEKPVLHANFYVMIAASFVPGKYHEALENISRVIHFFHEKPFFNQVNSKALAPVIEQFTLHLYNLDLQTQAMAWQCLGMPYCPSVCYKIQLHYQPGQFSK